MNTDHLPDYDIPWKPIGREPVRGGTTTGEPCNSRHVITVTSISTWGSKVSKFAVCVLFPLLGACSSPTDPSPYIVVVAGGLTTPSAPQQSDYAMGAN